MADIVRGLYVWQSSTLSMHDSAKKEMDFYGVFSFETSAFEILGNATLF